MLRPKSRCPMPAAAKKKAKSAKPVRAKARETVSTAKALGALPEWNLADLYPAYDAQEVKRDLERADAEAVAFEEAYKGKLAGLAAGAGAGAKLAEAVKRYEALDDLLGRLISFAGLFYAGNTTDPVRTKFYGDMQERITAASLHLLFFTLELNRLDDAALDAAMADPALGHYRPWIEDVRKEKPYQLEDRVEELFHEKSVTGAGAWNRLFDETMGSLRFKVDGKSLAIEQTLSLMQDASEKKRRAASRSAGQDLQGEPARLHADHQHARQGQGDFRPLARLQGHRGCAASLQSRRARSRRCAGRRGARRLSAAVASLLRAEGQVVRQEAPAALGPQRAAAQGRAAHDPVGSRRRTRCSPPTARSRRAWRTSRSASSHATGSMRRRGPASRRARSRIRRCPSAHPYVLLNYQGKPRDVMTLAHELGHGVHQVLAAPNGALMAPTPLTLAETASVFGEMLTFQKLLAETKDVKQRRAMLAAKVEDMINTVVRQIAFYTFERKIHTERRKGELTAREDRRDLDERAGRKPRPRDRAQAGLRSVLELHPALHPFAVLRLRLCVRRLPGELALCGLREIARGFCRALSRDALGRRHQASLRIAQAVRARCARSEVLAGRPVA